MPDRFRIYDSPADVLRLAQLFSAESKRELLLAAIRESHPAAIEAIDPRPQLPPITEEIKPI